MRRGSAVDHGAGRLPLRGDGADLSGVDTEAKGDQVSLTLSPGCLEVSHLVERELADHTVDLGYRVPRPVGRNMIGKVGDADDGLLRAEAKDMAAQRGSASAGAKLQQRALNGSRPAPTGKTQGSHALKQPSHPR
jgi:hypothetical protein